VGEFFFVKAHDVGSQQKFIIGGCAYLAKGSSPKHRYEESAPTTTAK
ncbi:8226_t:CDS:1, partial [Acaulospora morrowiae]